MIFKRHHPLIWFLSYIPLPEFLGRYITMEYVRVQNETRVQLHLKLG